MSEKGGLFKFIKINNSILELVEGDITKEDTEAIVNAANSGAIRVTPY